MEFAITGLYKTICKEVYDGDTITVEFNPFPKDKRSKNWLFKIRMYGYNSPELKPRKNVINREEVIKKAKEARDYLKEVILNKEIIIECFGFDNFGRLLAIIYLPNQKIKKLKNIDKSKLININEIMLQSGYGIQYLKNKKIIYF